MLRIMIVDDTDIVRIEMKRLKLWGEKTGFIISDEAKNGHEALEKLEECPVDMVITDIRMPKVDGIELLKAIMEKKLCPCVVLLSDHSEFKYARQGLVLGAFDYMVKPVDEREFHELLQRAKEFILTKRTEQQRVKELEQKLGEKVEVFFPRSEVSKLIDAIKAGDERAIGFASHISDMVYENLDQNLIKSRSLLSSIMNEVSNEIAESFKWMDKFTYGHEMDAADFSKADEPELIKEEFVFAVEGIMNLLRKLKGCANDNEIVDKACKFALENIDEEISLAITADSLFLNKSYLSEVFKQKTGVSFVEYLTIIKMERAKKLIHDERLKVYEIAQLLGFKDIEYFSRLFKKHTGASPTEYRHSIRKDG